MEGDPHTVIEGILIGAYAVGAKECFIYVRGEYQKSIELLRKAVKSAEEKGLTGDVTIKVISGAGAYVCGEGTAIVNSLEGLRGEPRLKPPSMAVKGLHQKPTVVNNVETFAVIPEIVAKGADWFGAIGAEKFPGTKLMCLSGDVTNPNKCIKCRRCVDVCGKVQTVHNLAASGRGCEVVIGPAFLKPMAESDCIGCGRCVQVCPTGAIYALEHKDELVYYAHRDGIKTAAAVSAELIPELERVLHRKSGSVSLPEIVGALKKIGVDTVVDSAEAEDAARAQAEKLLDERLGQGKPVILTNSFAAKAFLGKIFPDRRDSFLFYDSALAVFGRAAGEYDKRFAFGPVGGDAMECDKTGCVDIAVNARELARIMIRTGSEPNPKRRAAPGTLGLPKAAGKYEKLLAEATWNMDAEPERFEENDLRCVICHNLSQARRALAEAERYDVIRVIA